MTTHETNNTKHDNGQPDQGGFDDMPVIYSYTRAQAIEDGVLVDLTEWARETGFVVPVACTSSVWHEYIVPPEDTKAMGQSERGRAHDVLFLLFHAIRHTNREGNLIFYKVGFLMAGGKHRSVELKAHCGPGDQGEPVMTIMQKHED
ncbi:MAG: DUF6573 family protein [Phycisphaeraceae bacterium]